jgi:transcriptional regulator with XRE-family HTH domain
MGAASGFGAELRRLRFEAGLGTRLLAARSGLSRRSVQYFEAEAMRPRRCTIRALAYGLDPDNPGRRKKIIARRIKAAGGTYALAPGGKWPRYRKSRFERGLLNGSVPLPADIERQLRAMRLHDALRREAWALLERPGALDDGDILDRSTALLNEARQLSDAEGGPIVLRIGGREVRVGFEI